MGSFTKFLIVLLTVFSIFLCGTVVTYVASANNYQQEYKDAKDDFAAGKKKMKSQLKKFEKKEASMQDRYESVVAENTDIKSQMSDVEIDLSSSQREARKFSQQAVEQTTLSDGLRQTVEGLRTSLEGTSDKLAVEREDVVELSKKLDELTVALEEKIVELETLVSENKRLIEVKADLEKMISGTSASMVPVTQRRELVKVAPTPVRSSTTADLKALVSEVDLRNKLLTISIGAVDGISAGMKFHITRGNEFICDLVITDVDADRAAGVMELVVANPRIGDNASTNL